MKKIVLAVIVAFVALYAHAQIGIGTTSPNSTLDVRGSLSTGYRGFTANTSATSTDNLLVFTGTTATTLTLPTAVGCTGRAYMIKNASTTVPTPVVTVATSASQTIDAAASWLLDDPYETLTLVSNGMNWVISAQGLPVGTTDWSQNGNAVSSTKTLGTNNNYDLPFITNNTEKMRLNTAGNLGVGTSAFNGTNPEKLLVDAGTTTSVNAIVGKGSIDSYLQLNIQNNSTGTSASSDVVATANNGSETTNYVDMGINGGSYAGGIMGAANDAYLYNMGQNFLMGTGTAAKSLVFMTGGTSQASNERMRIDGSGNVGIGTTSPSNKLTVNGTNPLFLNGVQTGSTTDSLVMIMNGVVKKLSPSALTVSSSNAWALLGNNNTLASNYFLGTTNTDPLIIKTNSAQVGRFNINSLALGLGSTTNSATHSFAIGSSSNIAFGKTNAYAIGTSSSTTADNSFAIGNSAITNGSNSFAIGNNAAANNTNSVAIGSAASTAFSISDALAIGSTATTNSSNSIAIGKNATVGFSLSPAIAIGNATNVDGSNGIAIGNGANLGFNTNAMALGSGSSAAGTATNSTALGYNADVTTANTVLIGDKTNAGLSVALGSENFSASREKLLVDAGTTTSFNVISGKGSIDNYLQLNIQNNSAGLNASSDVVATANNGNETTNYVDMGINGGSYTGGYMGSANDAYLYNQGQNFLIGTGTAAKSLILMTGGTTQASNERMRIDGTGNVGIATTSPTQKLDVNGNLRLSGAFMPANTAGTAGNFLISSGAGSAPTWFDASGYAWLINGNSVASTKTLGTTNAFDLPLITNNTEKMRITSAGTVGIGTSTFNGTYPEKLLVDAGTTTSVNAIVGKGTIDSYLQLNIQNNSTGTSASSDVVATANNGSETTNYIDMGVNGGNYTGGVMGAANDGYLYNMGQNLLIGTGTAAKSIVFMTGGTTQATNERMRIDGNGKVGIGNTAPNSTLQVTGSMAHSIVTKTTSYTATASDYTIVCNNVGGITITLPAASGATGRVYVIKKISGAVLNVTIDPNASETIDGAATRILTTQNESVMIQCDGTSWYILSKN